MRRTLRRSVLAAGGTLLAGVLSRKFAVAPARAAPEPADPAGIRGLDAVQPHAPMPLPALSFIDADGHGVSLDQLRAAHGGRGLVLNLWATWCVPCVAEMPALDRLAAALAPTGIPVLAVALDHGGAPQVRAFYAAHQIRSLPVLLDPHSESLAALGLDGIPATLLVNAQGREVARIAGAVDWQAPGAVSLVTRLVS